MDDGADSRVLDADVAQISDVAADAAEDTNDAQPASVVDAAIASQAGFTGIDAPSVVAGDASAVGRGDPGTGENGCDCHIGAHNVSSHWSGFWMVGLGCLACLIRRHRRRG